MNITVGSTVDRYTFEGLLGTGGMAAVYLARHTQLGGRHAVKVLMLPSPAIQARLLQEGRAQSQVSHPNIVTVTDVIDVGGAPGLVMEYVPGPTLRQLLKTEVLELDQVDRLARGILRGVAAAHRAGLVHRDLKPGNVLLQPTDESLIPKITDFGLAKVLQPGPGNALQTRSGVPMGTPSYMAPEQIRDAANVDARADLWALGCILYEMVTGHRAFEGADVVETYRKVTDGSFVPVRTLAPAAPDRMVDAIEGALRVDPSARFAEVSALLGTWRGDVDLSEAATLDPGLLDRARALVSAPEASEGISAGSGPAWQSGGSEETWAATAMEGFSPSMSLLDVARTPPPAAPTKRSRPWTWGLAGLVAVALVGGGGWLATRGGEPVADGFTVDAVPVLLDDPVVQEELAAGWDALLDADFEEAVRRLTVVVESEPDDPRIWLLYSRTLHAAGRGGSGIDALWEAEKRSRGRSDPGSELARLLGETRNASWSRRGEDLLDWLDRNPDDYLGHLAVLSAIPATERELSADVFAELQALDPDVALTAWLASERALRHEEFDLAEEALRAGLEVNPRNPTLLAGLGDVLLRRGRVEEARDALLEALDVAPGHDVARTRLAAAWLLLGDDAAVDRITRSMTAPPTRWAAQAHFAQYMAEAYVGLGRLDEAVGLLERAGEEAERRDEWTTALVTYGSIPVIYMDAEMVLPMVDATEALIALSHQPEIPDSERENLVRNLLYARGIGAVRTGKLEQAEQILVRLRGLDRVWPVYIEWLEREIAIARARPDDVYALQQTTPEGCVGDLEKAHALYRAGGGHPKLVPLLDRRLGAPEGCSQVGTARFLQAVAHVSRAELAWEAGDAATAARHLAAFDALWPAPDGDIPAVERARSLAIRMR